MTTTTGAASRDAPGSGVVRAWVALSQLVVVVVFSQAVFAGLLLSGEGWGRDAHRLVAFFLVAATPARGVAAAITLRRLAGGPRLALSLLGLGIALAVQMALGLLSAGGERLLWLHVPLGVALVSFAADLVGSARRLGRAT